MTDRKTWFEAEVDVTIAAMLSRVAEAYAHRGKEARAAFMRRLEAAIATPRSLPFDAGWGGVSVRVDQLPDWLPVTGKDGNGDPTPTVRELAAILLALPAEFQGMPVARYCDDGVSGMRDEAGYESEHREDRWTGEWTRHVQMW